MHCLHYVLCQYDLDVVIGFAGVYTSLTPLWINEILTLILNVCVSCTYYSLGIWPGYPLISLVYTQINKIITLVLKAFTVPLLYPLGMLPGCLFDFAGVHGSSKFYLDFKCLRFLHYALREYDLDVPVCFAGVCIAVRWDLHGFRVYLYKGHECLQVTRFEGQMGDTLSYLLYMIKFMNFHYTINMPQYCDELNIIDFSHRCFGSAGFGLFWYQMSYVAELCLI